MSSWEQSGVKRLSKATDLSDHGLMQERACVVKNDKRSK